MEQETSGLGEQAINKIAEVAIASQLQQAADVRVQIKTDLNQLGRGQLDSMAITIYGLLMSQNLRTEEFHLQIGQVTVKPLSALRGKIKLVHPSTGTLRLVVNETSFTTALNAQDWVRSWRSRQSMNLSNTTAIAPVKCSFSNNTVTITTELIQNNTKTSQKIVLVAVPEIASEGQEIVFQNVRYVEGNEPSPTFTTALLTQITKLLSLQDLERQGTTLELQQLSVIVGKLILDASILVEQFPSS